MRVLWWGLMVAFAALTVSAAENPYVSSKRVPMKGELAPVFARVWKRAGLEPNLSASDGVWLRRLYINSLGRVPTPAEQMVFEQDSRVEKYRNQVDRVLDDPLFVDLWTMRWGDLLRVKSEFPINLWPNATVVYQRRIHDFLESNESVDGFARSLLTSQGSNFRDGEVNFFRAMDERDSRHIAATVAQIFLGLDFSVLPDSQQCELMDFFAGVRYKSTKEWKEEIVHHVAPTAETRYLFPGGEACFVPAGGDPRAVFCDAMTADVKRLFARTMCHWTWVQIFGKSLVFNTDFCNQSVDTEAGNVILNRLADIFVRSNYDFKTLCREILNSPAYRTATIWEGANLSRAERLFCVYPVRRLDAEVLDDLLSDLLEVPRSYQSVIPEPFTFFPPGKRTVNLYDGSINSSFLLLFGRPARDNGRITERDNTITVKQRQYLFNSRELNSRLWRVLRNTKLPKRNFNENVTALYRSFYCRAPLKSELDMLRATHDTKGKEALRRNFYRELTWAMLNSKEFLYQH